MPQTKEERYSCFVVELLLCSHGGGIEERDEALLYCEATSGDRLGRLMVHWLRVYWLRVHWLRVHWLRV
jgi:hypothetical protein